MRRIAAAAAFCGLVVLGGRAWAERLAVAEIAAPPELAVEAEAIELLVKSSVAKLTLVPADAPHDHTATATLARAGTNLVLDVAIIATGGKRETASIVAGDGDVAALATGMVAQIGEATHATQLPVRPFALGDLRPYATALRLAARDPDAATAQLADGQPVVASGVPAIPPAFSALLAVAPSPAARLVVARAIGRATDGELEAIGDKAVEASARAFAALERGELSVAEAALAKEHAKEHNGLVALARAAIAVERNDPRLGALLEAALAGDQARAVLALASTVAAVHVPPALYHRVLLPRAERAVATSPQVASRLGYAAAQAKVDVPRALALVSVRELDHYALEGLEPLLASHPELPKALELRLRAELAMRRRDANVDAAIAAYAAVAKDEPRALQYAAWSKATPRPAPVAPPPVTAGSADDEFRIAPPSSSPFELVLPIVAGVGTLVVIALLLLRRTRRTHRRVPAPIAARPIRRIEPKAIALAAEPRPAGRLKIDMTTPKPPTPAVAEIPLPAPVVAPATSRARAYPAAAEQSELGDRLQGLIDVDLHPAAEPPRARPLTLPPPIEIASASRSPLDVDRDTPPPQQHQRDRQRAPEVAIAVDDLGLASPDLMPPGGAPAVRPSNRASTSIPFEDVELGPLDMMPVGSASGIDSATPDDDMTDFAIEEPGPRIAAPPPFDHPNLVAPGTRIEARTLLTLIADHGEVPWLEAVGVIDQICAGLAHAHAHGVIHGGIQPSAIFIAGRVSRLGEFNLPSKRPYIAPDRNGTAADDLYAIGAVLAVMLGSGEMPPRLAKLVTDLRAPIATRPRSVADVRTAFKALFDF